MRVGDIARITRIGLNFHCFKEGQYVKFLYYHRPHGKKLRVFESIKNGEQMCQELGVGMYVHKPVYNIKYREGTLRWK